MVGGKGVARIYGSMEVSENDKATFRSLERPLAALGPAPCAGRCRSERLRARVAAAVRESALLDLPPVLPGRRAAGVWGRVAWFAMGAAAAVLAVCVFQPGDQGGRPMAVRQEPAESLPPLAEFPAAELAEKSRLLAGMEELFGGRLAWLAENGGEGKQVQLGLLPEGALLRGAKPMAVRVVVFTRKTGSPDWKPVWQADLVAHDEQLVELPQDNVAGATLRLWTQRLPDGLIAVDSELALGGRLPVRSSFSGSPARGSAAAGVLPANRRCGIPGLSNRGPVADKGGLMGACRWSGCLIAGLLMATAASAADLRVSIEPAEKWCDVFGGSQVKFHYTVRAAAPLEGRLRWSLSVNGRTVEHGELPLKADAEQAAEVVVPLELPTVNEGVILSRS